MIRPTLPAAILFAATIPLAILILGLWPGEWRYVVDVSLFALGSIGLDAALCPQYRAFAVTIEAPARVYVGSKLAVALGVAGAARARSFEIVLELKGPAEAEPPIEVSVDATGHVSAKLAVAADRRGIIEVEAVWLRWRGPLGLAERVRRVACGRRVEVAPDIRSIQTNALRFDNREAIDGVKAQTQKGEGAEFESLRDHAVGMDNRFIDWKHSAKHRKLLSKEFKIERNHHVVLAYDTGHLMAEPIGDLARLDHAIHAGLQLAWVSLRYGDYVGSYGFDARIRQFTQPSRGMRSFLQLQRSASQLGYHFEETNFTLGLAELNARLKRRALVVLFTEFVDTTTAQLLLESVQRMANRHAVIFVTLRDPFLGATVDAPPSDFLAVARALVAADFVRERTIALQRLQRMGVHCLEAPARGLALSLVNRYLAIKQRALL
jgi:uncharacterized protein (DUF58 family)